MKEITEVEYKHPPKKWEDFKIICMSKWYLITDRSIQKHSKLVSIIFELDSVHFLGEPKLVSMFKKDRNRTRIVNRCRYAANGWKKWI